MGVSRFPEVVDARPTQPLGRGFWSRPLQFAGAAVVAVVLLGLALVSPPPPAVRGDDDPRSGQKVQAADPGDHFGFASEIRRTLKTQHDRMIDLANQLLGSAELPEDLEGQFAVQQTKIDSAKANLEGAVLTREAAVMAVVEYERGIFVQEKATAEAEVELARGDLERAGPKIQIARDRSDQIAKTSKGSTTDIANEFRFAFLVQSAQFEERRARFATEQAEGKLKVLLEYEKGKRAKELRSEVEKARSNELASKATWDLEQSKLGRLQRLIKAHDLPERKARDLVDRQPLVWLDRAIPIEEQIRAKLEQLAKDGKLDDPLRKEIQDLTKQLESFVDQAEIARSAAEFDKLKTKLHAAPSRRPSFLRK